MNSTMRSWVNDEYGTPEVLELREVDIPAVEEDHVLVRVSAASVNPYDWHMLTGKPYLVRLQAGFRRPKSPAPGSDFAGVVEVVGDNVTEFQPGDEVFGEIGGAFGEFVRGNEKSIALKPPNVSFEEAAAAPMVALTAIQGLRDSGKIRSGQKVLINGASGGVGTMAVQIAKSFGAEVTAVCSTRNVDMVRSIGSDHVIDYTQQDFTRSGKYDLVLDAIGTRSVLACRRTLASGGTYVAASGPKSTIRILGRMVRLLLVSVVGRKKMRPMLSRLKRDDLVAIAGLLESGDIAPVIDKRFSFSEVRDALQTQGDGHAQGKTVIVVP